MTNHTNASVNGNQSDADGMHFEFKRDADGRTAGVIVRGEDPVRKELSHLRNEISRLVPRPPSPEERLQRAACGRWDHARRLPLPRGGSDTTLVFTFNALLIPPGAEPGAFLQAVGRCASEDLAWWHDAGRPRAVTLKLASPRSAVPARPARQNGHADTATTRETRAIREMQAMKAEDPAVPERSPIESAVQAVWDKASRVRLPLRAGQDLVYTLDRGVVPEGVDGRRFLELVKRAAADDRVFWQGSDRPRTVRFRYAPAPPVHMVNGRSPLVGSACGGRWYA